MKVLVRVGIATVIIALLSCAGPGSQAVRSRAAPAGAPESRRLANLRRAAQYPWMDEGACAAREAAGEWGTLVERCYDALDLARLKFRDLEHRCPVAQADAATLQAAIGICLLVQPELVVGAIIVIGVVVVASAIAAEIAKEEEVARAPVSTKPCWCTCLGKADPTWNPDDPEHGDPNGGWRAYPAECRSVCKLRAFPDYQCL